MIRWGCFDPPGPFAPTEELWDFLTKSAPHLPKDDPYMQDAIRQAREELKRRAN